MTYQLPTTSLRPQSRPTTSNSSVRPPSRSSQQPSSTGSGGLASPPKVEKQEEKPSMVDRFWSLFDSSGGTVSEDDTTSSSERALSFYDTVEMTIPEVPQVSASELAPEVIDPYIGAVGSGNREVSPNTMDSYLQGDVDIEAIMPPAAPSGLMSPPTPEVDTSIDDAVAEAMSEPENNVALDISDLPLSLGTTTEEGITAVKETQSRLRELGYYKSRVDGVAGKGTKSAIKTFQYNNGLDTTGVADEETRALLSQTSGLKAQPKPQTTLLKYISEGEGGYGAANNGTSELAKKFSMTDGYFSDSVNKPLTEMSVNELMNEQMGTTGKTTKDLLAMNPESKSAQKKRKVFAVGAYQIIPKTMWSAVRSGAIKGDTVFSPKTQDKIAMDFLAGSDRPKLRDFLAGNPNVSVEEAMLSLAQQWASAPAHKDMITSGGRKVKKGDSYYGSGNKALHTVEETKAMLLKARDENTL